MEIVITKFENYNGRQHAVSRKFLRNACENFHFYSLQLSGNTNSFAGIFERFFII